MSPQHAAALEAAIRLVYHQDIACFAVLEDKRPAWRHGLHDATRDLRELRKRWADSPGVLVGVPCGPVNDLAVLDCDTTKHAEAAAWLTEVGGRLPPTFTAQTRSGGRHFYFRNRPGLKCSAGRIAVGIDVRAAGGYICHWPSARLPVLADLPLAPWPDWLVPSAPPENPVQHDPVIPTTARLAALVRTVATANEGERNRLLFWCACRAGESVATGLLSEGAAVAMLVQAATACGLDAVSAGKTAISGIRKGSAM